MKRMIGITTAALMSASMLAAPAFAESLNADGQAGTKTEAGASDLRNDGADAGAGTNGDAGVTTTMPDTGVDTGTTAAIGGTFDGALSAISGNAASAATIEGMSEVESVSVVRVDELEGHDQASLDQAVDQNGEAIEELRSSLEANAEVSQELEAQGIAASDVVAAQVEADGKVTVYVM